MVTAAGTGAYLRYAQVSVAMALAEASHHFAPMRLKTARVEEEVEHETYDATGVAAGTFAGGCRAAGGSRLRGCWDSLAHCGAGVGRQDRRCRAAVPPPTVRAEEEEKAREEAVVKELEEELVERERRLLQLVGELRGAGSKAQAEASRLELAAIRWCMVKNQGPRRGRRRKKKKKRRKPGCLFTCSS